MVSEGKKRRQVLLRLPEELVKFLKERARAEGLLLTRFCEKYLGLVLFLELHRNSGQIITRQTKRRLLMIPAVQYDQMYGANATYREGRRLGLDWAPMLGELSVEDTLAIFSIYGWGIFEFQADTERILYFNPPISSSEFIRGLIEGLTGLTLQTLTADRDVYIYKIVL
ncbi:MAG: hypothetical protein HWN66_00385 [Candidatus Helarchaeota archaeon]|nr:hypothetical protein [Candidatus Helarchaeota archaeon]